MVFCFALALILGTYYYTVLVVMTWIIGDLYER